MIGLGKWKCTIDHTLFKGVAYLTVFDKDGKYDFKLDIPDAPIAIPEYEVCDIVEEGNELSCQLKIKMLPMKISVHVTVEDDSMFGEIKIPFVGDIILDDVEKIDE